MLELVEELCLAIERKSHSFQEEEEDSVEKLFKDIQPEFVPSAIA